MADEPTNPQQIIDDATNALEQAVVKPPKKKGGKGMLIGMLLFLILTLPVAIYYGSQQITDIRSRAAVTWDYACMMSNLCAAEGTKVTIGCVPSCTSPKVCCKLEGSAPIITPTPTAGPSCGALYEPCCGNNPGRCDTGLTCSNIDGGTCITTPTTVTGNKMYVCRTGNRTCTQTSDSYTDIGTCAGYVKMWMDDKGIPTTGTCYTSLSSCNSACSSSVAATPTQPTTRTPDGTWHNCSYLNNTGSTGPVASGCDSSNCGGQSCGQFTFKCGVYCLAASCGAAACYDDTVGSKMYYCKTDTYSCIQTTDSYTDTASCVNNVNLYGQKPNSGICYTSQASCQSACQAAGSFMYVCNTSTYQCTQTSSRYTSITACEGGND